MNIKGRFRAAVAAAATLGLVLVGVPLGNTVQAHAATSSAVAASSIPAPIKAKKSKSKTAVLVTSNSNASTPAWAYATKKKLPVWQIRKNFIPQSTIDWIKFGEGINTIHIVGGKSVISNKVVSKLKRSGLKVKRIAKSNSVYKQSRTVAVKGWKSAKTVYVATARSKASKSKALDLAMGKKRPVILIDGKKNRVDAATRKVLKKLKTKTVVLVGDVKTMPAGVGKSLKKAGFKVKHSFTKKLKLKGAKPKISGTAKVGTKLKPSFAWSGAKKLTYVWKVEGKTAATSKSYVVKPVDAGKKITVTVASKTAGYKVKKLTSKSKTVTGESSNGGSGSDTETPTTPPVTPPPVTKPPVTPSGIKSYNPNSALRAQEVKAIELINAERKKLGFKPLQNFPKLFNGYNNAGLFHKNNASKTVWQAGHDWVALLALHDNGLVQPPGYSGRGSHTSTEWWNKFGMHRIPENLSAGHPATNTKEITNLAQSFVGSQLNSPGHCMNLMEPASAFIEISIALTSDKYAYVALTPEADWNMPGSAVKPPNSTDPFTSDELKAMDFCNY